MTDRGSHRRRRWRRIVGFGALVAGAAVALGLAAPTLHLFDSQPIRIFAAPRAHPDTVAVFVSGDMGLRFGAGARVAPALAARGVPVFGVSSPVNFPTHRSREQVAGVIADAIRTALARSGARRVLLMGQSFGADMVATIAPDLPADLRAHIAAILLIVPGNTAYFRADPTGLTYHGTPDAHPAAALRRVGWAPVVCIYGEEEPESLCPDLTGSGARVIPLPGGHFLHHDDQRLIATLADALDRIDPAMLHGSRT